MTSISFALLLLIGPFLAFAIKGLSALLSLAGLAALISLLVQRKWPEKQAWRRFLWPLALLAWMIASVSWSAHPDALETLLKLLPALVFYAALSFQFGQFEADDKARWRKRYGLSLMAGVLVALALGPWPFYAPGLEHAMRDILEIPRQVNRSIGIIAVLIFSLIAYLKPHYPRQSMVLLAATVVVAMLSQSQSAALSIIIGLLAVGLAHISVALCRRLILLSFAASLVLAVPLATTAFEQNWTQKYAPEVVKKSAAPTIRSWIYYVYAQEIKQRPLIGHGLQSAKGFSPNGMDDYVQQGLDNDVPKMFIKSLKKPATIAAHAHSLFLQILFELGVIGAILAFMALRQLLPKTESHISKWVLGTWAAGLGTTMFSYHLWQSWLIAALLLAALTRQILLDKDAA